MAHKLWVFRRFGLRGIQHYGAYNDEVWESTDFTDRSMIVKILLKCN